MDIIARDYVCIIPGATGTVYIYIFHREQPGRIILLYVLHAFYREQPGRVVYIFSMHYTRSRNILCVRGASFQLAPGQIPDFHIYL